MDQASSFWEASPFESIEFVSTKLDKFGTSWIFKEKGKGQQLFFIGDQFDTEAGKFLVVQRVQPAAWKQPDRTKLREEKRVSSKVRDLRSRALKQVKMRVPKKLSEYNVMGAEKARPKAGQILEGVTKVTNPGEGDCLFHSVSQSIEFAHNKTATTGRSGLR